MTLELHAETEGIAATLPTAPFGLGVSVMASVCNVAHAAGRRARTAGDVELDSPISDAEALAIA